MSEVETLKKGRLEMHHLLTTAASWGVSLLVADLAMAGLFGERPFIVRIYRWRRRRVPGDIAWKKLNEHIDSTIELLGPGYDLTVTTRDGVHEIHLMCRKCRQKNRLVQGFANAKCGRCHEPLCSPRVKPEPLPLKSTN